MRVVVTGSGGMVGTQLVDQARQKGWNCEALARDDLDISDAAAVSDLVEKFRPDLVFNAGAYTAVDKAEFEPETASKINALGAGNLARAVKAIGATIVHISTDYVFDGESNAPYLPSDRVNPVNVYGNTKLGGEQAIAMSGARHLIVRTSWVYSNTGRNFVRTMLTAAEQRPELRVVNDQRGSPTSAHDLAEALIAAGEQVARTPSLTGLYHFSNAGVTTWYEFARAIFELRGGRIPPIVPVATSEYPTPARRPRSSVLDSSSFTAAFGVSPRPWREALAEVVGELA